MRKSLIIMFVLFCGFTAVAEEKAEKKLSEKIIGEWQIDTDSMKKSFEEQEMAEEQIEFMMGMMGDMEIEFDKSTFKFSMSMKVQEEDYTKESEKDNVLNLKTESGKTLVLTFIDDDTVAVSDGKQPALNFKRKK